jgi:hypothetical protein
MGTPGGHAYRLAHRSYLHDRHRDKLETTMEEGLIKQWSYSRLKDFEKCPYMLLLKVREKRSTAHVDTTAADRGTQIHKEAELFVKGEGDFTKNLTKFADYFKDLKIRYEAGGVALEEEWAFTRDWESTGYWDSNVWCRMKLDNFITTASDADGYTITGTATDYKSGKKFGNEVAHNQQGQLYVLGSFLKIPTLEACTVDFKYIDHGLSSKSKTYTRQKAMKFLKSWTDRATKLTVEREFPPKANKITCKYCPFGPQNGDKSCEWGVDA